MYVYSNEEAEVLDLYKGDVSVGRVGVSSSNLGTQLVQIHSHLGMFTFSLSKYRYYHDNTELVKSKLYKYLSGYDNEET
jgi:hypothetical protein